MLFSERPWVFQNQFLLSFAFLQFICSDLSLFLFHHLNLLSSEWQANILFNKNTAFCFPLLAFRAFSVAFLVEHYLSGFLFAPVFVTQLVTCRIKLLDFGPIDENVCVWITRRRATATAKAALELVWQSVSAAVWVWGMGARLGTGMGVGMAQSAARRQT